MFREQGALVSRAIDDALLEILEAAPAGAPGVDNGRHAGARRRRCPGTLLYAGMRVFLPIPASMRVNVDNAWVTNSPRASIVLAASEASICGAIAAIFPPKSRDVSTASTLCADRSHTRPAATGHARRRRYLGEHRTDEQEEERKTKNEQRIEISAKVILQAYSPAFSVFRFSFFVFR
jgi:hypothetical protein